MVERSKIQLLTSGSMNDGRQRIKDDFWISMEEGRGVWDLDHQSTGFPFLYYFVLAMELGEHQCGKERAFLRGRGSTLGGGRGKGQRKRRNKINDIQMTGQHGDSRWRLNKRFHFSFKSNTVQPRG